MPDRLPQDIHEYDSRFRCRYCGAPCRDGGVCHAHSDIHRAAVDTVEGVYQLSLEDVLALESAQPREDAQATKGKGSR
jgi:hypothetical protein